MASPPEAGRDTLVVRARRFAHDGPWRRLLRDGPRLTAWVLGVTAAFHLLYVLPPTHELAEDILVEDITAVALFAAAFLGLFLALRARRLGRPIFVWGFYALVALVVFLIGMEEIS